MECFAGVLQTDNILFDIDGFTQICLSKFFNKSVCIASNDGKHLQKKVV